MALVLELALVLALAVWLWLVRWFRVNPPEQSVGFDFWVEEGALEISGRATIPGNQAGPPRPAKSPMNFLKSDREHHV